MDPIDPDLRLSSISTLWTQVHHAHRNGSLATDARRQLLERYGGAVRRYLLAATREAEAAEELFQEFAVLFLRDGLRGADPNRGRFRDYLKGILFHLVADHHRNNQRRPLALGSDQPEPAQDESVLEREFLTGWRDELLARAWEALRDIENTGGQCWYTVLRFRADHPSLSSQEMASRLAPILNRPLPPATLRQLLHRARERFADLLLQEIAHALADPTPDAVEAELIALELLEYCRPALDRLRNRS